MTTMLQGKHRMTVSGLSKKSGIPVSTIKFYIRERLLPKPIKTGDTRGYYTLKHMDRLKLIKKMKTEGLTIKKIKDIVQMIDKSEQREQTETTAGAPDIRPDIIDSAVAIFREKGYEAVTISDIVNAANIGCSTFYKKFKNKKNLFMECIQKIINDETAHSDIETYTGKEITAIFERDAELSLKQDPLWRDMITMLRAAAINNPDEFADKLDEAIQLKIDMYENRIEKGFELGYLRKLDKTLLAVMVMGIQEYCSEYFSNAQYSDARKRIQFERVMDILLHGVLKK